ncbi:hypothetical protein GCM10010873_00520 [Cypionkella aquatica]|uniref:Uncharacterized protein n=1 Tax=Cypionkella aquatica TaxID=1756042 RepID=A0AA37TNN3_9RHOB|nr:hypothetical protein [Cypionkella aquatica]GLS85079.1 hypothetical protein GCM10010873_00520 [Cypionkella aquatica]
MAKDFSRPKITLPPEAEAAVRHYYAENRVILEYGSGGSTVIASEMPGKVIFSVESDVNWWRGMRDYFEANPGQSAVTMHHGKIGRTRDWGFPQNDEQFRKWPGYPLSIWDLPEFVHPDVVLIDGRFRPACFLSVLFKITRPITLLWDDYIDRPEYHDCETLAKPVEMHGRMARFALSPTPIPADRLQWIIQSFLRAH